MKTHICPNCKTRLTNFYIALMGKTYCKRCAGELIGEVNDFLVRIEGENHD